MRLAGGGWSLSSNVKLEAKVEAKRFTLSVEEYITSESFIIVAKTALPLVIFQNSRDTICFFSNLVWAARA